MCSDHEPATAATATAATDGQVFQVKGMTCQHCADSVTEEVTQVSGVEGVDVDLETGCIVVRGHGFDDAAIAEAVDEAGYEVVAS
jgi:copper chaperone